VPRSVTRILHTYSQALIANHPTQPPRSREQKNVSSKHRDPASDSHAFQNAETFHSHAQKCLSNQRHYPSHLRKKASSNNTNGNVAGASAYLRSVLSGLQLSAEHLD
jgi:predicted ATPase